MAAEVPTQLFTRRKALGTFSGVMGALVMSGCGGSSQDDATSASTASSSSTSICAATPEGEIGPYFTDDSATAYNRSDILSNLDGTGTQAGIPLTLNLYVYDSTNSCALVKGSQIDIWHCNASGVYSNESVEGTGGQTWLRGYQLTDDEGFVSFRTIVPGWYEGRTTHIHLRVRSSYSEASSTSDGSNTTQLFFPQDTMDYISTNIAPYNAHGVDSTTNANDHVYTPETDGQTLLTLIGDYTNGYTAMFSINLPITSS